MQIEKLFIDPSGRFIICDIKANKKCLTLANIYAPNEDDQAFFLDFFEHLTDFECDDVIIGGATTSYSTQKRTKKAASLKRIKTVLKSYKNFQRN